MPKGKEEHFGFKKISKDQKATMVYEVFESVASRYDLMNDLMSVGLHRLWKKKLVSMIRLAEGNEILDLAGGTGDVAFKLLKKAKEKEVNIHLTVGDINEHMLEEGRARAIDNNILKNLDWKISDAEKLPFKDCSFDYVTIVFGIRNVTDISKALAEIHRVLKPGGQFYCLEFSHVENKKLSALYDAYSFNIIPAIGNLVTGDRDSYQYLVESIRKFPSKDDFSKMIEDIGFAQVSYKSLTKGVVAIHSGWRI